MKKIILTLIFSLILINSVFAARFWYVDKNGSDNWLASDSATCALSFDTKPALSISKVWGLASIGDTICIGNGTYLLTSEGKLTHSWAGRIYMIGYGEVILQGSNGVYLTTNDFITFNDNNSDIYIENITFKYCNKAINLSNKYNWTSSALTHFNNCKFLNNNYALYSTFTSLEQNWNIYNCVFANNNCGIYCYGGAESCYVQYLYNCTFYNNDTHILSRGRTETGGAAGSINYIYDCIFDNGYLDVEASLPQIITLTNCNNYQTTYTIVPTLTNCYAYQPLYVDTTVDNYCQTEASQLLRISSGAVAIGANECGQQSKTADTTTWSGWNSWTTSNTYVSVYNDSMITVNTTNGLYLSRSLGERRLTKSFYINNAQSFPKYFNITANEYTGIDVDTTAQSIVDYDTTTMVKDFRYMLSSEDTQPEQFAVGWVGLNFGQSFGLTSSTSKKYIIIEVVLHNNYAENNGWDD